jgi:gluconate kinase
MTDYPLLFVTFGLPGAGKSYAARCFQPFGFYYHDGDLDLPETMKAAIADSLPINDTMRDTFFQQLIASTERHYREYPCMVVAQTFIKEKYRLLFLERFPGARFVLVEAETTVREMRLARRDNQPLDPDYARRMTLIFDPPRIPHSVMRNDVDGSAHLMAQIQVLVGYQD